MTTTRTDRAVLTDAARVLAARHALEPVLQRLARTPLDPVAVGQLRSWLDDSYPRAAAALDRLRASDAAALQTPGPRRATPSGRWA